MVKEGEIEEWVEMNREWGSKGRQKWRKRVFLHRFKLKVKCRSVEQKFWITCRVTISENLTAESANNIMIKNQCFKASGLTLLRIPWRGPQLHVGLLRPIILAFQHPLRFWSTFRAADHLIGGLPKFPSHICRIHSGNSPLASELIQSKILTLKHNSQVGSAPSHLQTLSYASWSVHSLVAPLSARLSTPVSSLPYRCTLCSAARGILIVPRMCSATAQSRSFAYIWAPLTKTTFLWNYGLSSLFLFFGYPWSLSWLLVTAGASSTCIGWCMNAS